MAKMRQDDLLMVLSDHGFSSFRRGVNLNRWLLDHGYLVLKPDGDPRGRVAGRRRLVADARVCDGADRHLPERRRP